MEECDYVNKSVLYVKEQRNYLIDEMRKLKINTFESHANYIFFKFNEENEEIDLKEEMIKKGILIRSCSNYRNLGKNYYRVAVNTKEENNILIEKLKEITGKK